MTIEKIKERIKKYEETDKVTFRVGEIVKIGEREFEFMGEDVLNKGLAFRFCYALNNWYRMNKNGFNKGGWGDCDLRETLNKEIWSILSPELKSIIKDRRTVYIDENGETKDCIDKLWLCSESELRGDKAEKQEGPQFELFKDWKRRIVSRDGNDFGTWQWARSVYSGNSDNFVYVDSNGSFSTINAFVAFGVAPCFII